MEYVYFSQLAQKGEADDELTLLYAMQGAGTNEEKVKKVLDKYKNRSPQERQALAVRFRELSKKITGYDESLEEWLEGDFGGAELLEPHGLVMVMEPLNFRDHSGMYLERSDHAYMLAKAVNSPSVKILFDIYHQSIAEGNLIPNIDLCWDEIGYFQIGDNPGRKEPTTGDVNYNNIFKHIHGRGWKGILGMEHGNSKGGAEGERAVIDAYRTVDHF